MADTMYGYRSGQRMTRPVKIDSTSAAISVGDFLVLDTAGYYEQGAADGEAQCVAMQAVTAGSSDGAVTILADFSRESIYEYPPDAGSVTQALVGKQCDLGGAQSIKITASATGDGADGIFQIVDVDTVANTVFVKMAKPKFAGV